MKRIYFVVGFFVVFWALLLVRIFYISVISHDYYDEVAAKNALRTKYIAPLRGIIYDRNMQPLAVNQLGFAIGIRPKLSSAKEIQKLEEEIDFLVKEIPSLDRNSIKKRYLKNDSSYTHDAVQVVDFLLYEEVAASFSKINLRKNSFIYPISRRNYPYGNIASHVIGYVGRANLEDYGDITARLTGTTGRTGIERYYNDILKGKNGIKISRANALNQEISITKNEPPVSNNVVISVDIELQKYISSLFDNRSGSAVVIDLEDGSILSAVSFPEYDLNTFVVGISHEEWEKLSTDFNHPYTNKFISGLYPPGSVVKMGVALSFLNSNKITPSTSFDCNGTMELGGRNFRCWNHDGHGATNMRKAIRESCDVYFYEGSLRVGIDSITSALERFGFGQKTGVDLPNEFLGVAPGREWKMNRYGDSWFQGETIISSIGQGFFLATPMQIAKYTAMLATERNITPHFLSSVNEVAAPFENNNTEIFNDLEKSYLPFIREAMFEVCNHPSGTAYRNVQTKVKMACKTGTAQVISLPQEEKARMKEHELEFYQRSHGWFTSFGPFKNPKYAVTVMVEHAGGAAPATIMASKIYNKLYEMGYITSYE